MKKTEQKVIKFIDENHLLAANDNVLVALSGGPDSVFLLKFLSKYKKRFKISLGAFHLNHQLRGKEADRDEKFCNELCKNLGISFFSASENIKSLAVSQKLSLEEAGRIVRYKMLKEVAEQQGFTKIATAHNAGDNAETVLLNLIKGAGLKGLSGIPVKRDNIIRPILVLSKPEVLEYLELNSISYRKDRSNLTNDYERNYLRNKVIPLIKKRLNPSLEKTILSSSAVLRNHLTGFESQLNEEFEALNDFHDGLLHINLNKIKQKSEPRLSELIKLLIERNFYTQTTFKDISKVIGLLSSESGTQVDISKKIVAVKEREEIVLFKNVTKPQFNSVKLGANQPFDIDERTFSIKPEVKLPGKFPNNRFVEYISADDLEKDFTLRLWKEGDRFRPLGLKGTKKVSDFLNEQKIKSLEKKNQLVLTNKGRIVWVVGLRIDDRFKITNSTKKVYQICLI